MKHTARKLLALMMALSLGLIMTGMTAFAVSSNAAAPLKDGNLLAAGAPEKIISADLVEEIYEVPLELREVDGRPFVLPV